MLQYIVRERVREKQFKTMPFLSILNEYQKELQKLPPFG